MPGKQMSCHPEQPKNLALFQFEVDAVHGHHAPPGLMDFGQRFNFDDQGIHPVLGREECLYSRLSHCGGERRTWNREPVGSFKARSEDEDHS